MVSCNCCFSRVESSTSVDRSSRSYHRSFFKLSTCNTRGMSLLIAKACHVTCSYGMSEVQEDTPAWLAEDAPSTEHHGGERRL